MTIRHFNETGGAVFLPKGCFGEKVKNTGYGLRVACCVFRGVIGWKNHPPMSGSLITRKKYLRFFKVSGSVEELLAFIRFILPLDN